jgi:ATP-binding cassette subfamily C protein LapB
VLWLARRLPDIVKDLRPLQSHKMAELENRLAAVQEQGTTRDGLRGCVDYAFKSMGARSQAWSEGSAATRLPAAAIHPDIGAFILHQHTPAGGWLLEDASGNRHVTVLPEGALYSEIQASHGTGPNLQRTAGDLFRGALRENRRYFIHAAIASVVINLFGLLTSLYSMQVYDRVIPTQGLSTLYALTAGIAMGILLELVAKFARATITEHSIRSMDTDLSHSIFERLLRVRMDQFPASVGTLSAQLRSYEMIRSFASSVTLYLLVDTPFAVLFLAVIYLLGGPLVAAVPVVFFIVALAVGFLFRRGMETLLNDGAARFEAGVNSGSATLPILPTLAITDSVASGPTNAPVTYTFTFSEAVTGFDAGDITVTNGTKGTFTATSATVYTLVVTPTANAQGADIGVSVNSGTGGIG